MTFRIPGTEAVIVGSIQILVSAVIDHRIDRHVNDGRLAAGKRFCNGNTQLFALFHFEFLDIDDFSRQRLTAETLTLLYQLAKELNMPYEYNEIPGASHGPVINQSLPSAYAFFAKHSKPSVQ